jgi:hypothetical protein
MAFVGGVFGRHAPQRTRPGRPDGNSMETSTAAGRSPLTCASFSMQLVGLFSWGCSCSCDSPLNRGVSTPDW